MPTVLIVDDDAALRDGLAETVVDLGYQPVVAASGEEALSRLSEAGEGRGVDAVLLDLNMPGALDGLTVLRRLREECGELVPPVAVLTAFASAANTIEAMRLGAFDHLTKPIGREELAQLLGRMLTWGSAANRAPGPTIDEDEGELVGSSEAMRRVVKAIGLAADSDATVLILGETGTGKEMAARALHRHGRRRGGRFVPVNCAAIPAELLESELFGHVRGAFTGASSDRNGAFREADGGTLFLDEIGDMPLAMQTKILRALQERSVTPVGTGRPQPVDVRVVAATHRDLPDLVRRGGFRQDLYYRLAVVPIELPPLRERLADILPLAERFLRRLAPPGTVPKRLSAAAAGRLLAHAWPGNVRELKNAMERASVLVRGPAVEAADLDLPSPAPVDREAVADEADIDLPTAVARLETAMIRRALAACGGNRADAARRLGIHGQLLYDKMRRYGLS